MFLDQETSKDWTREEAIDFAEYLLKNVATRKAVRGRCNTLPLRSDHESKGSHPGTYRQSDLAERIYLAFQGLRQAGMECKEACLTIAENLPSIQRRKKRGRPRRSRESPLVERKAKSVHNRVAAYEKRWLRLITQPDLDRFVQFQIDRFLFLRRTGMLVGSDFPPDSGERGINWYYRERERIYGIAAPRVPK